MLEQELNGLRHLDVDAVRHRRRAGLRRPVEAGIAAAVQEAAALLAVPGVAGVNLSGLGSARGYEYAATVKAELARRIREEHGA